jgi:hypothetical protein
MPKPTRDYALIFRNEITKLDVKIAGLQAERSKLVQAYVVVTGDQSAFGTGGVSGETAGPFRANGGAPTASARPDSVPGRRGGRKK